MPAINFRLTDEDHATLKLWAERSHRSIQQEITFRLFARDSGVALDEGWPVPEETRDYFRPDFGTKLGTKPEGKKKK